MKEAREQLSMILEKVKLEESPLKEWDNLTFEKKFSSCGYKLIAGVDEVGRGPLAGPVVCASVIMPLDDILEGVTDSKKLSEKKRVFLDEKIREKAVAFSIAEIWNEEIDEINILNATKKCMKMAIDNLKIKPDIVFIDAVKIDTEIEILPIIKGDLKSYNIASASIIAKVYRDKLMVKLGEKYLGYGFEQNKGYGTQKHIDAIREKGICEIHRKTFTKNFLEKTEKI